MQTIQLKLKCIVDMLCLMKNIICISMAANKIFSQIDLKRDERSELKEQNLNDQSRIKLKDPDLEDDDGNRTGGHLFWFFLIAICTATVPILNLTLFIVQPMSIPDGKIVQFANQTEFIQLDDGTNYTYTNVIIQIKANDLSVITEYRYYYVLMAAYSIVTTLFIIYSSMFSTLKERLKLYLLIDNILICQIATDVSFLALQVQTFCIRIFQNPDFPDKSPGILISKIDVGWQDIMIMIFYVITNFAMIGCFRVLMVNIKWSAWKVIIYKLAIIISSIFYIVLGVICLYGQDSLSKFADDMQEYVENQSLSALKNPDVDIWVYVNFVFDLDNVYQFVKDYTDTAKNILLLYVFTNFGFSFEIVAKLSDFDGTADLQAKYELEGEKDEENI